MMVSPRLLPLCALLLAATPVLAEELAPETWQQVIRAPDRKRLAGLWHAWTHSLGEAGQLAAPQLAAVGDVASATAARAGPPPEAGAYRCRTVKLGRREGLPPSAPVFVATAFQPCRILHRDGLLWFEQEAGPQRLAGLLYPDEGRLVFLGSMALAGEIGVMNYGADAQRDQVGVLRSIGERRWRLELPWPKWQSTLCVVELVPA